jgi:hypothetical protein
MNPIFTRLIYTIFLCCLLSQVKAQQTVIWGTVTDARSHTPLPYVTVAFANSTKGTSTDNQGKYRLAITGANTQLQISFIGYKTVTRTIESGKSQQVDISLSEDTKMLSEVLIKSDKKKRYTNKITRLWS